MRGWIAAALLLPSLLLIALHWPALDHEFVWTDQGEIVHGILIQPPGRLLESFTQPMHPELGSLAPGSAQPYYRPLQVVVATTIDSEFGRRPRAFRSVTLALGALTMGLFAGLCWWLFRDPMQTAIAAAIAAAHPVGIEMYVWIASLAGAPALFVCGARALVDAERFEEALAIAKRVRDLAAPQIDPVTALVAIRAQIGLGRIEDAEQALAAIPKASLRGAAIDAERRQVEAMLRAASLP